MKLIKMYLKTSSLCVSLYICFCFALHFHSIIFIYFSYDWVLELFVFLVHTSVNKDKTFLKLCIWQVKTPNFLCILASEFLLRTLFHLRKASQQWQMSEKYWKYLNRNRIKEEGQSLEKLCQADKAIVCLQTCHQMTKTGTNMRTHTLVTTKSFLHVPLSIPGFPGISNNKKSACNVGDLSSFPRSERSSWEGSGNPLLYSFLGNPMDRGAWRLQSTDQKELNRTEWLSMLSIPFTIYNTKCKTILGIFQVLQPENEVWPLLCAFMDTCFGFYSNGSVVLMILFYKPQVPVDMYRWIAYYIHNHIFIFTILGDK